MEGYIVTDGKFKVNRGYFPTEQEAVHYLDSIQSTCEQCTKKLVEKVDISIRPWGMEWVRR